MELISAAMALSQFAPSLIKWLTGSDKAEAVAQKAVDIAQAVTGTTSPDTAINALKANPDLIVKYRQSILDQELEFEKLAVQNASDINATMRAEAASEHWPTYSWRPFIGFCFGLLGITGGLAAFMAFGAVMFFGANADMLSYIPTMLGAEAAVMATMAPVLGIASWFRGKMQADPTIPTINKG